ncbi:NADP-dependent oxidoreductase domain-containing protein [Mycena belliarum]|uniref:NADP-dependent oxidoreductase domain-containing protein n=1 Tax=Mycena belliarum TaxID=1033014 RepID=A0AAD6U5I7_9AGAR|nr:NADP-dependent oxidoreductase domain-containing protein [Mycena belliae]
MSSIPSIKLNTGASIPAIGLGAFTGEVVEGSEKWILTALQAGYRHIDTARVYGTEPHVGTAIRASGLPREDIFVTTKLPWHHGQEVSRSLEDSLKNFGLDYLDLYLMHFPISMEYPIHGYAGPSTIKGVTTEWKLLDSWTFNQTWAAMEALPKSRVRAIGVSNFSIKTLEELLKTAKVVPAVLQVEIHPYLAQTELVEYCHKKGITVTAYSPTGLEKVRSDPTIVALAAKYGVSAAQIILAWHVARGVSAVPKSADPQRQKDNVNLPTLSPEDVASITALDRGERIVNVLKEGKHFGWSAERLGW